MVVDVGRVNSPRTHPVYVQVVAATKASYDRKSLLDTGNR